MENQKVFLSEAQAIHLLGKFKKIHTYSQSPNGMLFGLDWNRKDLVKLIKTKGTTMSGGGPKCRAHGHGLIIHKSDGDLFVAVDNEELDIAEKEAIKLLEVEP